MARGENLSLRFPIRSLSRPKVPGPRSENFVRMSGIPEGFGKRFYIIYRSKDGGETLKQSIGPLTTKKHIVRTKDPGPCDT